MTMCPQCANKSMKRSDAKGFVEVRILPLLKLAPFLCSACGRRSYHHDSRPNVGKVPGPPEQMAPVTFLTSEDGVSFQQLISNLRDAERRLDNKGVAQRELGR